MNHYLIVFVGAGLGGMLRHSLNAYAMRVGNDFPWHTMVINISGSLLMGLLIGWLTFQAKHLGSEWRLFVATGILGGFTTFSAFSLEAALLWERGAWRDALVYVVGSVVISILALFVGLAVFRTAAA